MRAASSLREPAPPYAGGGGGGGGWRWVVTARGIVEAELIKGALEATGIVPVVLDAHDPSPGAWMFPAGNVNALVRVLVPASLLEGARLALLELAASLPAEPRGQTAGAAPARTRPAWLHIGVVLTAVVILALILHQSRAALW